MNGKYFLFKREMLYFLAEFNSAFQQTTVSFTAILSACEIWILNNDNRTRYLSSGRATRKPPLLLNNVSQFGNASRHSRKGVSHLGFTKKPSPRARKAHLTHCTKGIYLNADLDIPFPLRGSPFVMFPRVKSSSSVSSRLTRLHPIWALRGSRSRAYSRAR